MVDLLEQLLVVQHHLLEECPLEEEEIVVTMEVKDTIQPLCHMRQSR